jgi:hypothetical protein
VSEPLGVEFPTVTGVDGTYRFEQLESSAGTGSGAIRYQVRFGTPATGTWVYTTKNADTATTSTDSDVWATTAGDNTAGHTAPITLYADSTNVDAGMYRLGSISGVIWEDLNDNGVQDDGAAPWPHGVSATTVKLNGTNGKGDTITNVAATVNADGTFTFPNLLSGSYTVTFDKSAVVSSGVAFKWALYQMGSSPAIDSDANWAATGATGSRSDNSVGTGTFTLGYATALQNVAAGVVPTVSISGHTWEDKNFDGVANDTDAALSGVPLELWLYQNGAFTQVSETGVSTGGTFASVTDAAGNYTFTGLRWYSDASYQVRFGLPTDNSGQQWTRTAFRVSGTNTSSDSDAYVNADTGATAGATPLVMSDGAVLSAGYYRLSQISGYLWHDSDGDGMQDVGEQPVSGVVVKLFVSSDGGGTWVPVSGTAYTVTTTDTGRFVFADLRPGLYRVEFDKSAITNAAVTYNWTLYHQGDSDKDSDANPYVESGVATSASPLAEAKGLNLAYNSAIAHIDGGLVSEVKTITGYVWEDKDYDGISGGSADTPWGGVVVNLYQSTDNGASYAAIPYAITTSDAAGSYRFDGPNNDGTGVVFGTGLVYRVEVVRPQAAPDSGQNIVFTGAAMCLSAAAKCDIGAIVSDVTTVSDGSLGHLDGIAAPAVVNAGLYRLGSLSGIVWEDLNDNGIQDDDPTITGHNLALITVRLQGVASSGETVDRTVNAASDGSYVFDLLRSGDYTVSFDRSALDAAVPSNSFKWSTLQQGSDATRDSDAVPSVSRTDVRAGAALQTLDYAARLRHLDGGLVPYIHVTGFSWLDANLDGERQAVEVPVPNVLVQLWRVEPGQGGGATDSSANSAAAAQSLPRSFGHQAGNVNAVGTGIPLPAALPPVPIGYTETLVSTTVTGETGQYGFDELPYEPHVAYKVVFVNPDAERYLFSTSGVHNTANYLVETAPEDEVANRHLAAHTDYQIKPVAHSEDEWCAGLREAGPRAPTGGTPASGVGPALTALALTTLLAGGLAIIAGTLRRRKGQLPS